MNLAAFAAVNVRQGRIGLWDMTGGTFTLSDHECVARKG